MPVIVNNQTKLNDLQTQLLDGSRIKDDVHGFKDKDGSIILYTKPSHTGLRGAIDRATSSKSRALAREGLQKVFDNHARDTGKAMTATVRTALNQSVARGVKVGALGLIAQAAKGVRAAAAQETFKGASLADLGVSSSTVAGCAKQAVQSPKSRAAAELGRQLGDAVMAGSPEKAARDLFTLATGQTFKAELKAALRDEGYNPSDSFLDDAFEAACGVVGLNRMDAQGQLVIGGETYAKVGHLGAGGGGTVDEYVNVSDPSDRLAFKTPIMAEDPDAQLGLLGEIKHHETAERDGHPNVLESKGGVRLPDGKFGYAMQLCSLGNMDDAFKFLDHAASAGTITAEEALDAKITLFHDAMQGMAHIEKGQVAHRDLKPGNFFIAADGSAKIADFGEAVTGDEYRWQKQGSNTPYYASPEVYDLPNDRKQMDTALTGMTQVNRNHFGPDNAGFTRLNVSPMRAAAREILRTQLPTLSDGDRESLLSEHQEAFKETTFSARLEMGRRDAYAMGAAAYSVLHGKAPGEGNAWAATFYDKFRADASNRLISEAPTTAVGTSGPVSKGFLVKAALLADLTNQMTTPESSDRRGIRSGLDHDVFKSSGVGSSRSRDVIKEVVDLGMAAASVRKVIADAHQADELANQAAARNVANMIAQAFDDDAKANERAAADVASVIAEAYDARPSEGAQVGASNMLPDIQDDLSAEVARRRFEAAI